MTALLSRLVGLFYVAPATRAVERRRSAVAPSIAVLAPARDVVTAGCAVALAAARDRGEAAAVVCVWTGGAERAWRAQAPARPAARRLAAALARRGHAAECSGRLVTVWLEAEEAIAAAEAARVTAACGAAPVVLALGGARGSHLDGVLRGCDLTVVVTQAGADPALAPLALAGAESLGVPAVTCEFPATPIARMLASRGARLPGSLRSVVRPVVDALP